MTRPTTARFVAVGLATIAVVFGAMAFVFGETRPATDGGVLLRIKLAASEEFVPAEGSGVFSIAGDVDGLYPGGSVQLPLTLTNPNAFAILVNDISATRTSPSAACDVSNISVGPLASAVTVPANSSSVAHLPVTMSASAGDGCQGVIFGLAFGGSATSANPPTPTTSTSTTASTTSSTSTTSTTSTTQPVAVEAEQITSTTSTTTTEPPPATGAPRLRVTGPGGAKSGPPGSTIDVDITDLPPSAAGKTLVIEANGRPIGTATARADGTAHASGLKLPGDLSVRKARISAHVQGESEELAADEFTLTEGVHRPELSTSVAEPGDVSFVAKDVGASAAAAAAGLLLFFFPSEIFDSTFAMNEERIRRFLQRLPKLPEEESRLRRTLSLIGCVIFGGLLFTGLNSPLNLDSTTLLVFVSCVTAVALMNFGLVAPDYFYIHAKYGDRGYLNTIPGGLAVGAVCVLASRIIGFQPGYVYGVVAGWVFKRELDQRDEGTMAVMTTFLLMAVALGSWFLRTPVAARASAPHAAIGWVGLEAALVGLFLCALQSAVVALLPMRFLRGRAIWEWSKTAWIATSFVTLFLLVHILSTGTNVISRSHTSATSLFVVFTVFALLSAGFWLYFRFVPDPIERHRAPSDDEGYHRRVAEEQPGSEVNAVGGVPGG